MLRKRILLAGLCMALGVGIQAWADDLAKESEAKAAASSSKKATPELIVEKIDKACVLLEKEGTDAFPKFKGKESEFLFAGTYIWINDLSPNMTMLMHPIKQGMEGKPQVGLKDVKGKLFFAEMFDVVKKKGAGWVDYYWPKPGEKQASYKMSYVKGCTLPNGKEVMVGSGTYDITPEEGETLKK